MTGYKALKKVSRLIPIVCMIGISFFAFAQTEISKKQESAKKTISPRQDPTETPAQIPTTNRNMNELHLHSVGIGIGQTFLGGKFGKSGDDKITADFFYNYSASHSFDAVINFHHSKHKFKQFFSQITGLALSIKGKFYQFDSLAPFAMAGLGFYSPKVSRRVENQVVESSSKLTFGNNLGLGAELRLNRHVMLWILAQYHNPFDVKQDIGPEVEGRYTKLLIAGFYSF